MDPFKRWTRVAIDVTQFVTKRYIQDSGYEFYGLELSQELHYSPGTIYPVLRRMEDAGWLLSREEPADDIRTVGRPARTYFRVDPKNFTAMRQRTAELDARYRTTSTTNEPGTATDPSNKGLPLEGGAG
ncbi:PadR family transcriptional regulator [Streptomyces virginiae]|uniref:PadR family transcriptional regulator n=1 Tax=Streptomyces virginiae TaxID=1961 RepID=UPI003628699C